MSNPSNVVGDPNVPDLPFTKVTLRLPDEELPCVSINIPCYLRRKFIPLMIVNLMSQSYPKDKLEVVILQDGPQDLFMTPQHKKAFTDAIAPIKLTYIYEPNVRRKIGDKRNKLVKLSKHKIIASMDSDDIYNPHYIRTSVNALKEHKVGITSSAAMMFCYPHLDFKLTGIKCGHKHQGHEACCVFTKKHFNSMGGFGKSSQGEGTKMISYNEKKMVNLDINYLMICVCHTSEEGNTIDKNQFLDKEINSQLHDSYHKECLKQILNL